MPEYYRDEVAVIYHDEAANIMSQMPANCVDLIATDPPYGIDYQSNHHKATVKYDRLDNDKEVDTEWLTEAHRILHYEGAIYVCTKWTVSQQWIDRINDLFNVKSVIVWHKNGAGGMGDLEGSYSPDYELVIFAHKGRHKLRQGRDRDVWSIDRVPPNQMVHPTQKPVELFTRMIVNSTDLGDIVLDPFMGSGTTLRAAKNLGRKAIGIEVKEEFCEQAVRRLGQEVLFV